MRKFETRGRKPNKEKDEKLLELRKKGLTFRAIAKQLDEDVKTTHLRYKRLLAYLSTGKPLTYN